MVVGSNRLVHPCTLDPHAAGTQGQSTDSSSPSAFPFPCRTHPDLHASVVVAAVAAVVGDTRVVHVLDPIFVDAVDGTVTSLVDAVVREYHDLAMLRYVPI